MEENKQIKNYKIAYFHVFFICLFFLHLGSIFYDQTWIRTLTKPLICSSLLISLIIFKKINSNYQKLIAIGLFFGCLGDIFLMLNNQFISGLIAFLIGHICYILAFAQQTSKADILRNIPSYLVLALLFAYSYYFFGILSPSLGILKIPVLFYIITISSMCFLAYNRNTKRFSLNFMLGFLGSILFIISDSVLALNKFVAYIPSSGLIIMSTYMLAQYFIYSTALFKSTNE